MITIIKNKPDINGAYKNQSGDFKDIPDGFLVVPNVLLPIWEEFKPFVEITIENDIIVGMVDNPIARATQEAVDTEKGLELTPDQRIAELEVSNAALQNAVDLLTVALLEG